MDIRALVLVGSGLYDLLPVAGVPAVVRAVWTVLAAGSVDSVTVLGPPEFHEAAAGACAGLPVHVVERVVDRTGVVIVHEAVRPFAPVALVSEVVAAMRAGASAVVPVVAVTDTIKQVDVCGELRGGSDRAGLRAVQSPFAFRADLLPVFPLGALDLVRGCAAAGVPVHTVPGDPLALALRSAWDLERAALLPGATP